MKPAPFPLAALTELLDQAQSILIVPHVFPDGDALGSLAGMGLALMQMNKQVTLACEHTPHRRFHYLPILSQMVTTLPANGRYDLIIALDCGDEGRIGQIYSTLSPLPPIINIDHHITNTNFGQLNIVHTSASSTAEILYQLFLELKITISREIATALLTGLVTDTLSFRTASTTANTLKAASGLLEAGADLFMVTTDALVMQPFSTLRLWQIGFANMRLDDGFLWVSISNEERERIGHLSSGSAGLASFLANTYEAIIGAVLIEYHDGYVYGSFRTRPPYNVSELAFNLGGGGHDLAAGCRLEGPLAKAEALVAGMGKEAVRQQRALFADKHDHHDYY